MTSMNVASMNMTNVGNIRGKFFGKLFCKCCGNVVDNADLPANASAMDNVL